MKILSDSEKNEHWNVVLQEGAKGTIVGLGLSFGLVSLVKKKRPAAWTHFSTSMKAAMWAMPTVSAAAFFADQGSFRYDEQKYRSEYFQKLEDSQLARWEKMTTTEKIATKLNENKYKIIIGAWAGSLYGSWRIVDRDPYMSTAQKVVQARVYAQGITVVLLLSTLLLSMYESELKKKQPPPVPEWKKYLDEQAEKKAHQQQQQAANDN